MKKNLLTITLIMLTFITSAQELSLMTYNIRYATVNDGENRWEKRKEYVSEQLLFYAPDIFGIQEGLEQQVNYLDESLASYAFVGVGRDDGIEKGEYTAIFFNKKVIELLETNTYWLSEKPDTVSVGWDAAMERIVTYGQFRNKSDRKITHVFNCHYDHVGEISREKSSDLILELIKIKGIEDERIALIGDLNCLSDEEPIEILKTQLEDSYEVSQSPPYGPVGTFNGFNSEKKATRRIDYILIKNITVKQYTNIDDRRKNNLWLSDHMPILIKIE